MIDKKDWRLRKWIEPAIKQDFVDPELVIRTIFSLKNDFRGVSREEIVASVVYYLLKKEYGIVPKDILQSLCSIYNVDLPTIYSKVAKKAPPFKAGMN